MADKVTTFFSNKQTDKIAYKKNKNVAVSNNIDVVNNSFLIISNCILLINHY